MLLVHLVSSKHQTIYSEGCLHTNYLFLSAWVFWLKEHAQSVCRDSCTCWRVTVPTINPHPQNWSIKFLFSLLMSCTVFLVPQRMDLQFPEAIHILAKVPLLASFPPVSHFHSFTHIPLAHVPNKLLELKLFYQDLLLRILLQNKTIQLDNFGCSDLQY